MGNRAVITNWVTGETQESFDGNRLKFRKEPLNQVGVYVHWNGGKESIQTFLMYCKMKEYRSTNYDDYGWARLCQVIGNFFGGSTSIGISTLDGLDCCNGDNGTYLIKDWEIVDRYYNYDDENCDVLLEDLIYIDECQPVKEQLGKKKITELFEQYNTPNF